MARVLQFLLIKLVVWYVFENMGGYEPRTLAPNQDTEDVLTIDTKSAGFKSSHGDRLYEKPIWRYERCYRAGLI